MTMRTARLALLALLALLAAHVRCEAANATQQAINDIKKDISDIQASLDAISSCTCDPNKQGSGGDSDAWKAFDEAMKAVKAQADLAAKATKAYEALVKDMDATAEEVGAAKQSMNEHIDKAIAFAVRCGEI